MAEERVQRRLAAILAADVVGYSRLMGEDEASAFAVVKAKQIIDERGVRARLPGTITTSGKLQITGGQP